MATLQATTRILPNGTYSHTVNVARSVPQQPQHEPLPKSLAPYQAHIQSNK